MFEDTKFFFGVIPSSGGTNFSFASRVERGSAVDKQWVALGI